MTSTGRSEQPHVGLFVTCPVDLMRPSVGFATIRLLEEAGCRVTVPPQSCCGQVAYNNGLPADARRLAWQVVESFRDFDYLVTPSGSCAAMLREHYPSLFEGDSRRPEVNAFCDKVHELTRFLVEVVDFRPAPGPAPRDAAYHDSCAGLRELGIRSQPRDLLAGLAEIREIPGRDVCCGFGGTFCTKFPAIANRMVEDKTDAVRHTGAELLVGGDVSCLIHIAGKLKRQERQDPALKPVEVRHIAEVLAGDLDTPGIGDPRP